MNYEDDFDNEWSCDERHDEVEFEDEEGLVEEIVGGLRDGYDGDVRDLVDEVVQRLRDGGSLAEIEHELRDSHAEDDEDGDCEDEDDE